MANQGPLNGFWLWRFAPLAICESLFGTLQIVMYVHSNLVRVRRKCPDSTAGTSIMITMFRVVVLGGIKADCR